MIKSNCKQQQAKRKEIPVFGDDMINYLHRCDIIRSASVRIRPSHFGVTKEDFKDLGNPSVSHTLI